MSFDAQTIDVSGDTMVVVVGHPRDLLDHAASTGNEPSYHPDGPQDAALIERGLAWGVHGSHGRYKVRVTPRPPCEAELGRAEAPFEFGMEIRHGELYVGDAGELPPLERWRPGDRPEFRVRVESGIYRGKLYMVHAHDEDEDYEAFREKARTGLLDPVTPPPADWVLQLTRVDRLEQTPLWSDFAEYCVFDADGRGRSGAPRVAAAAGPRVSHPKFGEGVVLGREETAGGTKLRVRFASGDVRTLLERFVQIL